MIIGHSIYQDGWINAARKRETWCAYVHFMPMSEVSIDKAILYLSTIHNDAFVIDKKHAEAHRSMSMVSIKNISFK